MIQTSLQFNGFRHAEFFVCLEDFISYLEIQVVANNLFAIFFQAALPGILIDIEDLGASQFMLHLGEWFGGLGH